MYQLKIMFERLAALLLLLMLSPIYLLLILVIWLRLGRPVVFIQERPGLHGAPFRLIKFRTMLNDLDENGKLLSDEARLTPFGRLLRATSLDELPELWNVVKGEMSLVGPRPLLMEYLPLYSNEQARRHDVLPGITGWAQINGRNDISWPEKFELDVWYVDNWSIWLDIKIMVITLKKVMLREGIQSDGHVTMPAFGKEDP